MSYAIEAQDATYRLFIQDYCMVIRRHAREIEKDAKAIVGGVPVKCVTMEELIEAENTLESALIAVRRAKAVVAVEA